MEYSKISDEKLSILRASLGDKIAIEFIETKENRERNEQMKWRVESEKWREP